MVAERSGSLCSSIPARLRAARSAVRFDSPAARVPSVRGAARPEPSGERRLLRQPHLYSVAAHVLLRLAHGVLAVMEYARCEHRIGMSLEHAVGQVLKVAHAAA